MESEFVRTGVFSQRTCVPELLQFEIDDGIDPDWDAFALGAKTNWIVENASALAAGDIDFNDYDESAETDCYEQSACYIGFVATDATDGSPSYACDPNAEFSAIVGMGQFDAFSAVQVVASQWRIRGAFCSPCFPSQVDANTDGPFLAYALPPSLIDDDDDDGRRLAARIFRAPVEQEEVEND